MTKRNNVLTFVINKINGYMIIKMQLSRNMMLRKKKLKPYSIRLLQDYISKLVAKDHKDKDSLVKASQDKVFQDHNQDRINLHQNKMDQI